MEKKTLTIAEIMERLIRVCPGTNITFIPEREPWALTLPKSVLAVDVSVLRVRVAAHFQNATFEGVINFAWEQVTAPDNILYTDGGRPWESVMVVRWNSEKDDWNNFLCGDIRLPPLMALARYYSRK